LRQRAARILARERCAFPFGLLSASEEIEKDSFTQGEQEHALDNFVVLLVLWFLGLVTSYTFGGFVHILLVLAVIALVFQLVSGRRAV
jgi:hypothetical protein